jgi:sRNA-binding carbon storage regulator CsrA
VSRGLFALMVMLLVGPAAYAREIPVEVRMLNGDVFTGRFGEFDGSFFRVDPGWGGDGLRFHAAYTGTLLMIERDTGARRVPDTRVTFTNGDRISGRLVGLNDDFLTLEAMWGQRLTANREFVRDLDVLPGEESRIFEGLSPLSDWSVRLPAGAELDDGRAGNWLIPEDSLLSRTTPTPESGGVLFEIEASFPNGMPSASMEFFQTSAPGGRQLEGMSLSLNPNWMHVRTIDPDGRHNWVLREPLPPETFWEPVRIAVYLNVETSEVVLRINEREFPTFVMHSGRGHRGREDLGFTLHAGRDSGGLRLHDVSFSRFSGVFSPEIPDTPILRDRVMFSNGDRMEADVLSMDGESVRLRLEADQEISLPRSRIRSLVLNTRPSLQPRRRSRDVELKLAERGDRITLALAEMDGHHLTGGGDIWKDPPKIPHGFVREVRLNIYQDLRHDTGSIRSPGFLFER